MIENFEIKRVMHELKRRNVYVSKIEDLSIKFRKITFTGQDLTDFVSMSADDHIKIFLDFNGENVMRDYTPLSYKKEKLELEILFVLHKNGPASLWASEAKVGDCITIGGPKGSTIIPHVFKQYIFIVDETGVPSTLRRLEELDQIDKIEIVFLVDSLDDKFEIILKNQVQINWILKNDQELLQTTLKKIDISHGDYFCWLYGEKRLVSEIKSFLFNDLKFNENLIKASSYWTKN